MPIRLNNPTDILRLEKGIASDAVTVEPNPQNLYPSISIGDLVSKKESGLYVKASPLLRAAMPAAGVYVITSDGLGRILITGAVSGLYTGLTPGNAYWVGINGRPVPYSPEIPPTYSQIYLQPIGIATDEDTLVINISYIMYSIRQ